MTPIVAWGRQAFTLLLVIVMVACDPAWHIAIRQAVEPATDLQCIAQVLDAQPGVDSVIPRSYGGLGFALLDPAVPHGRRQGWVGLERSADTLQVMELGLTWRFPAAGIGADSGRTRQLVAFAREATEQVRLTCAEAMPGAASCRLVGPPLIGGTQDCEPPLY